MEWRDRSKVSKSPGRSRVNRHRRRPSAGARGARSNFVLSAHLLVLGLVIDRRVALPMIAELLVIRGRGDLGGRSARSAASLDALRVALGETGLALDQLAVLVLDRAAIGQ